MLSVMFNPLLKIIRLSGTGTTSHWTHPSDGVIISHVPPSPPSVVCKGQKIVIVVVVVILHMPHGLYRSLHHNRARSHHMTMLKEARGSC